MSNHAAITVSRSREEVERLWNVRSRRDRHVRRRAGRPRDGDPRRPRSVAASRRRQAHRHRAAGQGQGRAAALQAARRDRARSRARTARRRASASSASSSSGPRSRWPTPSSRRRVCDEGERVVGPQHRPGRERPGSEDPQRPRRDRADHVDGDLRLGPAPLRRLRPDDGEGRHPRARVHGRGRRGRPRRVEPPGRRPRRRPVPDRVRQLLGVPARAVLACARTRTRTPGSPRRCSATRRPASSATRISPAATPAARRSTRACRTPTSGRSRSRTTCPTSRCCSCRTSSRPASWAPTSARSPAARSIAVFGAGPVGQFAIASAVMLGAERVIAIDQYDYRLQMARNRAGATDVDQLRRGRRRRRAAQGADRRARARTR